MNRQYAKTKRQFNYLIKQVTKLINTEKWEELSEIQKQKMIVRINMLYSKLRAVFHAKSLIKAMGTAALVLGLGISANAQSFNPPVINPFGLVPMGCSFLHYADIDDDGDLDAFYCAGDLYQENIGTSTSAVFDTVQYNPFGLVSNWFYDCFMVDLDDDGDYDMIRSGIYSGRGSYLHRISYHKNTGTNIAAQFATPVYDPFGINISSSGWMSSPMVSLVDLDDDGDMDMMIGVYGTFKYFKNIGSKTNPSFGAEQSNPFGLVGAGLYSGIAPDFSDVDGDGDFDMMTCSSTGDFYYYENTGTKTAPAFAAKSTNPFGLTNMTIGYNHLTFADLDNDGDDDIMVGDSNGDHYYFENTLIVGVTEFSLNAEVKLFPNPAKDIVNIQFAEQYKNVTIEVTALKGQLVMQNDFATSEDIQLNVAELKSGVYFVKITTEHKTGLQKLVIE